tara:strand:+ start:36 stop:530 length:495 start_codon:yes stop_codon:yes gene_type:complete
MFDNLLIKRTNNKFIQIYGSINDVPKKIMFNLKNVFLPFGIEEYKTKYVLNIELDEQIENHLEIIKIIKLLESKIPEITNSDFEIKNILKDREKHKILCRTNIKKTKNVFITKIIENNKEISIFDLKKNQNINLDIEISGIWNFNNKTGLFINIKKIYLIDKII